ncbi:MAG: single-stranded DNA-binding protein [Phycisphaerales bacterium]|nr:MAG: single-stranded DNA-binding protein [Phycisphaerales bacterium]
MANLNRVILAGNLTRDPQLSYTPNNTAVCKFGMAISRNWTDRNSGEKREETCFVDLTAFGRPGEIINQYMSKGRGLLVEGRLQFSQWTNPEGQKRSKLEVVVENFQFLDRRGGDGASDGRPAQDATAAAGERGAWSDDAPPPTADSDIPF